MLLFCLICPLVSAVVLLTKIDATETLHLGCRHRVIVLSERTLGFYLETLAISPDCFSKRDVGIWLFFG